MEANRYPSSSNQYSQRGNGIPPPKRPKLSIDKQSASSSCSKPINSNTNTKNCAKPKEDDFFDDVWGDELDEQMLKAIELDETLALSQVNILWNDPTIINP